jgi:heptosyltransferase-1
VRLLIVLPGAIGDVVRALPLLGRIRRAMPEGHLAWVVEPPSAPVLQGHPWLDEVRVLPRRDGMGAIAAFVGDLRAERWDVALDLGRGVKSALLARASGAPDRLGFARADSREGAWMFATRRLPAQGVERAKLEQFLAFGDLLGCPPAPIEFGLAPTAAEAAQGQALLAGLRRPIVAVCVGSSCPSRRWFPDRTAAVVDRLGEWTGGGAVLLGTPADAGFGALVARACRVPVRDLIGRTSLRQLVAVLARCGVAFGPDSGALHLAAAMGTPVVSLWGATSAQRSAPFGWERLTLEGRAPCAPCFLRDCPIGRVCMRAIDPDRVVDLALPELAA